MNKEEIYQLAKEQFGIVPGIIKEMTERSEAIGTMYLQGTISMEKGVFTTIETNAIELKISLLNHCESCTKGHSFLLKQAGMVESDIQSIINGTSTSNKRLNTLLEATGYIYAAGSDRYPDIVMDFLRMEEITEQEIFEMIGLIALKTLSNYSNNYLQTVKMFV